MPCPGRADPGGGDHASGVAGAAGCRTVAWATLGGFAASALVHALRGRHRFAGEGGDRLLRVRAASELLGVGEDVVDGDVDGDLLQPDVLA